MAQLVQRAVPGSGLEQLLGAPVGEPGPPSVGVDVAGGNCHNDRDILVRTARENASSTKPHALVGCIEDTPIRARDKCRSGRTYRTPPNVGTTAGASRADRQ